MAKWLDRLKSCFGRKTGEIVCATVAENIGRPVAVTPECTIRDEVETFTPKVGQLMLDKSQILELLRNHNDHSIYKAAAGWVIWNNKKQKYQILRSKPMVAINYFLPNADKVSISLCGTDLFVRRDQLQFK